MCEHHALTDLFLKPCASSICLCKSFLYASLRRWSALAVTSLPVKASRIADEAKIYIKGIDMQTRHNMK